MKGTEKQITWAEKIKADYIQMMDQVKEYYKKILAAGGDVKSIPDSEYPTTGMSYAIAYHNSTTYNTVYSEMKASDLYKQFRATAPGSQERKEAGRTYKYAVTLEALTRLEKAVDERLQEDSAAYWIEKRMR